MKNPVDIAVTLERDADKLPDLVFDKAGNLISGRPKSKPKKSKPKSKSKTAR